MIELPADLENRLRENAARTGQSEIDYLRQILGEPLGHGVHPELTKNAKRPREADPDYLLSLPKAERDRIMEAQAALAAPLYEFENYHIG